MTHQIEPLSHRGLHDKYRVIGERIQELGISFIGCQQVYNNAAITDHTSATLSELSEDIQGKVVIIMGSTAGARGIITSPIARKMASGMVLLNALPCIAATWTPQVLTEIPGWIDFYNSREDFLGHTQWAERIVREVQTEKVTQSKIDGTDPLDAEQALEGVLMSLRRRKYLQ